MRRFLGLTVVGAGFFIAFGVVPPAFGQPQKPSTPQIENAVAKAVSFLRSRPWNYSTDDKPSGNLDYDVGAAALIGLALLESDVSPRDPGLVANARAIRAAVPKLKKTYAISLALLYLDRFGGASEAETIRDLACRLVAGQDPASWGWNYDCPNVKDHRAVVTFLQANKDRRDFGKYMPSGKACNSNTQFALVALWAARRQKFPSDYILAKAEARFRNTQHEDGGWGYHHDTAGSSPAMTSSGMLGLAIGFANRQATLQSGGRVEDNASGKPMPKDDIRSDPAVEKAKSYLAKQLKRRPYEVPNWLYFLWSLERCCVIYGFSELDKVDWYDWGSAALIEKQKEDGSWEGGYPSQVNTAFALLFLRKANLAKDLAGIAQLKAQGGKDQLAGGQAGAAIDPARLARELPMANAARQKEILRILEETKDPTGTFTQELLEAIPRLSGELQENARQALAARLSRQSVASLRDRLADPDAELRLAAVRAVGKKQAVELAPDLVALLENPDPGLANAAHESLKAITKQNLGKDARAWQDFLAKGGK